MVLIITTLYNVKSFSTIGENIKLIINPNYLVIQVKYKDDQDTGSIFKAFPIQLREWVTSCKLKIFLPRQEPSFTEAQRPAWRI